MQKTNTGSKKKLRVTLLASFWFLAWKVEAVHSSKTPAFFEINLL
jgi:hypothetical protein